MRNTLLPLLSLLVQVHEKRDKQPSLPGPNSEIVPFQRKINNWVASLSWVVYLSQRHSGDSSHQLDNLYHRQQQALSAPSSCFTPVLINLCTKHKAGLDNNSGLHLIHVTSQHGFVTSQKFMIQSKFVCLWEPLCLVPYSRRRLNDVTFWWLRCTTPTYLRLNCQKSLQCTKFTLWKQSVRKSSLRIRMKLRTWALSWHQQKVSMIPEVEVLFLPKLVQERSDDAMDVTNSLSAPGKSVSGYLRPRRGWVRFA